LDWGAFKVLARVEMLSEGIRPVQIDLLGRGP